MNAPPHTIGVDCSCHRCTLGDRVNAAATIIVYKNLTTPHSTPTPFCRSLNFPSPAAAPLSYSMSNSSASSLGGACGMSASAIVAKAASGSHVLKIDGYSRTTGFGAGNFITSRSFKVGGRRWCLRYYPDGCDCNCNGWISILLCLDPSETGKVRALYKMSLLDQQGYPVASGSRESSRCRTFTGKGEPRGFCQFVTKAGLRDNRRYLKDDTFSVKCDITVVTGIVTEDVVVPAAQRGIKKEAEEPVV
ncbi:hypothetical protein QYE76_045324 [Lolium multiflorum]|uniref:MATH domain-containing protein n=1 Tax=Lolium multiflorum TaxID=4521 RepID=A0AAD8TMS8_LOLMU|nr:hypothetical protein QYE76_045324 [Lolium multiflorum]